MASSQRQSNQITGSLPKGINWIQLAPSQHTFLQNSALQCFGRDDHIVLCESREICTATCTKSTRKRGCPQMMHSYVLSKLAMLHRFSIFGEKFCEGWDFVKTQRYPSCSHPKLLRYHLFLVPHVDPGLRYQYSSWSPKTSANDFPQFYTCNQLNPLVNTSSMPRIMLTITKKKTPITTTPAKRR